MKKNEKEEIFLDIMMKDSYEESVKNLNKRGISVNSIEAGVEGEHFILTVYPTYAVYLYDIFFNMGVIYQRNKKS
jgi:hypothetical protein